MKTLLLDNETMVKEGLANLLRGAEAVGGRLFLSNMRLIFESHSMNIQTGTTIIYTNEISGVEKAWTKFLGVVPLAPNAMEVKTKDGTIYSFTLWGREKWISSIKQVSAGA